MSYKKSITLKKLLKDYRYCTGRTLNFGNKTYKRFKEKMKNINWKRVRKIAAVSGLTISAVVAVLYGNKILNKYKQDKQDKQDYKERLEPNGKEKQYIRILKAELDQLRKKIRGLYNNGSISPNDYENLEENLDLEWSNVRTLQKISGYDYTDPKITNIRKELHKQQIEQIRNKFREKQDKQDKNEKERQEKNNNMKVEIIQLRKKIRGLYNNGSISPNDYENLEKNLDLEDSNVKTLNNISGYDYTDSEIQKIRNEFREKQRTKGLSRFGKIKKKSIKLISIKRSSKSGKKMMATFETNGRKKVIHFGAAGMSDYTRHHDKVRRNRYIFRHLKDYRTGDPSRAGYLSMFVLWNKPSLQASIADYRRRLSVYNRTGKFPTNIPGYSR